MAIAIGQSDMASNQTSPTCVLQCSSLRSSSTSAQPSRRPSLAAVRESESEDGSPADSPDPTQVSNNPAFPPAALASIKGRGAPNKPWAACIGGTRRCSEPFPASGPCGRRGSCNPLESVRQLRRGSDMMISARRRCSIGAASAGVTSHGKRGGTKVVPLASHPKLPHELRRGPVSSRRTSIDMAACIMTSTAERHAPPPTTTSCMLRGVQPCANSTENGSNHCAHGKSRVDGSLHGQRCTEALQLQPLTALVPLQSASQRYTSQLRSSQLHSSQLRSSQLHSSLAKAPPNSEESSATAEKLEESSATARVTASLAVDEGDRLTLIRPVGDGEVVDHYEEIDRTSDASDDSSDGCKPSASPYISTCRDSW